MLTVRREKDARTDEENYFVEFDPNIPVEILLDTHIWLNMSKAEEQVAQRLRTELCFRFRYSMTNYIELLSQLAQGPTKKRKKAVWHGQGCVPKDQEAVRARGAPITRNGLSGKCAPAPLFRSGLGC
jgi:hypothetical protein